MDANRGISYLFVVERCIVVCTHLFSFRQMKGCFLSTRCAQWRHLLVDLLRRAAAKAGVNKRSCAPCCFPSLSICGGGLLTIPKPYMAEFLVQSFRGGAFVRISAESLIWPEDGIVVNIGNDGAAEYDVLHGRNE